MRMEARLGIISLSLLQRLDSVMRMGIMYSQMDIV